MRIFSETIMQSDTAQYLLNSASRAASTPQPLYLATTLHPSFSPRQGLLTSSLLFKAACEIVGSDTGQLSLNMENNIPSIDFSIVRINPALGVQELNYGFPEKIMPWAVTDLTETDKERRIPRLNSTEISTALESAGIKVEEIKQRVEEINNLIQECIRNALTLSQSTMKLWIDLSTALLGCDVSEFIIQPSSYFESDHTTQLLKILEEHYDIQELIKKLFADGQRGDVPAIFVGIGYDQNQTIVQSVVRYSTAKKIFSLEKINTRTGNRIGKKSEQIDWCEIQEALRQGQTSRLPKIVLTSDLVALAHVLGNIFHFGAERGSRERMEKFLGLEIGSTSFRRIVPEKKDGSSFIKLESSSHSHIQTTLNLIDLYLLFGPNNPLVLNSLLEYLRTGIATVKKI